MRIAYKIPTEQQRIAVERKIAESSLRSKKWKRNAWIIAMLAISHLNGAAIMRSLDRGQVEFVFANLACAIYTVIVCFVVLRWIGD